MRTVKEQTDRKRERERERERLGGGWGGGGDRGLSFCFVRKTFRIAKPYVILPSCLHICRKTNTLLCSENFTSKISVRCSTRAGYMLHHIASRCRELPFILQTTLLSSFCPDRWSNGRLCTSPNLAFISLTLKFAWVESVIVDMVSLTGAYLV